MLGTNMNLDTGIRYGVISQYSVGVYALDEIFQSGNDLDLEAAHRGIRADVEELVDRYCTGSKRTLDAEESTDGVDPDDAKDELRRERASEIIHRCIS